MFSFALLCYVCILTAPCYHCCCTLGTINAKGNLGITLRRYSKVNAEQGEELIKDTVQYLNTHEYHGNHPWLVKFGNENIITEAQRLAAQGKHDLSLEMYESLYKQKEALNQIPSSPTGSPNKLAPLGSSGIPSQASQDLVMIGTGKYSSLLGKAAGLVKKAKYAEAEAVLGQCAELPTELLGGDSESAAELQLHKNKLHADILFQKGHFEQAIGVFH
jgi:hypothetical protein